MLVDSHCHLNFPDFKEDLPEVVARAGEADVKVMQTICTHMAEFEDIYAITQRFANIYCSVGVHPHNADKAPIVKLETLLDAASRDKVIGIGETGLDFFYEYSPRKEQEESFRVHIAAARETGLPIIIHTRDADDDTIRILQDEMGKGAFPGLIHCFSSTRRLAEACLEMGLYISLSGILTFKKATDIQETAKDVPLERILVETDAPYLAPVPNRGKRNEPAFTKFTSQFLAELKVVDEADVARVTTDNFFRLFSKAERPAEVG